ncbi:hypothetical protein H0H93_008057, partial [Arthromyces matolae]
MTWIDKTSDKKATLSEIGKTVSTIHSILVSFQNNTTNLELEPSLLNALLGLGDILLRTREHIYAYTKARRGASIDAFLDILVPARVTQQLVLYATRERFSEALRLRFGNRLSDATRRRLCLRLDEFKTGGIALSTLERFVGDRSLYQAVEDFETFDLSPYPENSLPSINARLPLLIWVDDRPQNNAEEVDFAVKAGIKVIQFISTALLKDWIEGNEGFLRANDNADSIRFISDNARFEIEEQKDVDSGPTTPSYFLNLTAGENVARYLRGHL